jgi:hypothetical protein
MKCRSGPSPIVVKARSGYKSGSQYGASEQATSMT